MGTSIQDITNVLPGLSKWLRHVFFVVGGYIATTGMLVTYVANTGASEGIADALAVVAIAGATSIGWMTAVNFMIRSDFRWALLGLVALWIVGLLFALLGQLANQTEFLVSPVFARYGFRS